MKKWYSIILILCILFISGCDKDNIENGFSNKLEDDIYDEVIKKDVYIDDNPIKVGLYYNKKLVTNHINKYRDVVDIAIFDVYFTNDQEVSSSNTKYNFNKFYQNYENIDDYKIGFYVSFNTLDGKHEKMVLDPTAEAALAPYIYIYLYDDVHQKDGSWYSHATMDEYGENTVFSSIKLYMHQDSEKVISPIKLMVFTYNGPEDFDENGNYRGSSYYEVTISDKE